MRNLPKKLQTRVLEYHADQYLSEEAKFWLDNDTGKQIRESSSNQSLPRAFPELSRELTNALYPITTYRFKFDLEAAYEAGNTLVVMLTALWMNEWEMMQRLER